MPLSSVSYRGLIELSPGTSRTREQRRRLPAKLAWVDAVKERKYRPTCRDLERAFLPLGFTVWGAMTAGSKEFLMKVANAADEQGYVGEVWGTLQGG